MSATQTGVNLSQNAGPGALAADLVTRILAIIAVGLRFIARRRGGSKYWWDDWLILVAAILLVPAIAVEIAATNIGLGRHIGYILKTDPQFLPLYAKLLYADQLFYSPILAPVKLSILCLYVRLFGVRKSFATVCYVQMGFVIAWALITEFLFMFQCNPIWVAWNPTRSGGTCFHYRPLFIGTNTINVIMDFTILITPLPSIWSLKLPKQKKISVTAVLAFGACESVFSAARLTKVSVLTFEDPTWDDGTALIWSTVETAVGVLCACIPVMTPLVPKCCLGRSESNKLRNSSGYVVQDTERLYYTGRETRLPAWQGDEHELMNTSDHKSWIQLTA